MQMLPRRSVCITHASSSHTAMYVCVNCVNVNIDRPYVPKVPKEHLMLICRQCVKDLPN